VWILLGRFTGPRSETITRCHPLRLSSPKRCACGASDGAIEGASAGRAEHSMSSAWSARAGAGRYWRPRVGCPRWEAGSREGGPPGRESCVPPLPPPTPPRPLEDPSWMLSGGVGEGASRGGEGEAARARARPRSRLRLRLRLPLRPRRPTRVAAAGRATARPGSCATTRMAAAGRAAARPVPVVALVGQGLNNAS